jgi:hypothetical protein
MSENNQTPEPLATFLRKYYHVEISEYASSLGRNIRAGTIDAPTARLFRQQLADAINRPLLTAATYKALTSDNEYSTPEGVQSALREFWEAVFPGETVER